MTLDAALSYAASDPTEFASDSSAKRLASPLGILAGTSGTRSDLRWAHRLDEDAGQAVVRMLQISGSAQSAGLMAAARR